MKTAFGGNRLGSGNKMNISLKNYSRSTHNLTESFRSSMAPGVLYPFYVKPALNGDTFDIDLSAMARTLPTNGPLMGQFKLQLDMFLCPIRLYQGILHNNTLNIGLNMKDVKLPIVNISHEFSNYDDLTNFKNSQVNPSSLIKYLGVSGLSVPENTELDGKYHADRSFNAIPLLAYYDIFKNYYANKQEEKAYVLTQKISEGADLKAAIIDVGGGSPITYEGDQIYSVTIAIDSTDAVNRFWLYGNDLDINQFMFGSPGYEDMTFEEFKKTLYDNFGMTANYEYHFDDPNPYIIIAIANTDEQEVEFSFKKAGQRLTDDIKMIAFDLENIDEMRKEILSLNDISDQLVIQNIYTTKQPYLSVVDQLTDGRSANILNLNGLVVKTYQSDLFNNWMNTEWIDGENGIAAITTIDTSDGLNLDTLNLAQKVYNMLNRIATCGGTYQDWQKAVWSQDVISHAETPIYCGGMSSEIVFEEIASSAATDDQPLGTLAGKGRLLGNKGGKCTIKVTEPSFIIGIVSITPRIDYFQGNEWYMTDIETMDDFHKPELDGIGFQDLLGEQMAWWDTRKDNAGIVRRHGIGKVPAWINYMTAVDKVYGDFAKADGANFMVLTRDYSIGTAADGKPCVTDFTTYIDPAKFNYAFTDASRDAQNFWIQILTNVTARRVMSAKMIPNL